MIGDPPEAGFVPTPPILGYARAIRAHLRLCVAIVFVAIFGAFAWISTHPEEYEATAQLLVTPLAEGDVSFLGIPVVRTQGSDPGRAVNTVASLAENGEILRLTSDRLDGFLTPSQVEAAVEVVAVEDENIVQITATRGSGEEAADIANAYAEAVLAARRDELEPIIADAIERTEAELSKLPDLEGLRASELQERLADLRFVEDGTDPTLSIAQVATVPSTSEGPPRWLLLVVTAIVGIALAAVTAIVIEVLAPGALDNEDDLLRAYPLPVLARVPRSPRRLPRRQRGLELSPQAREAFRSLRGQLELRQSDRLREEDRPGGTGLLSGVIAITSATTGDGKTTTALSLARVTAAAGSDVIVLDADLRRPAVAERLGAAPDRDLTALLTADETLRGVATPAPGVDGLDFIPAPRTDNISMIERLGTLVPPLLEQGVSDGSCVIVDTAALGEVSDALLILPAADQVVIAVRMHHTTHSDLHSLRDALERVDVLPVGYVVFDSQLAGGVPRSRGIRRRLNV